MLHGLQMGEKLVIRLDCIASMGKGMKDIKGCYHIAAGVFILDYFVHTSLSNSNRSLSDNYVFNHSLSRTLYTLRIHLSLSPILYYWSALH